VKPLGEALFPWHPFEAREIDMPSNSPAAAALVFSYLTLRRAIGFLGIGLPFALVVGAIVLQGAGLEPSISDYYYTIMRNVFVGALCAIGVFLMSYHGYERADDIAGDLACIFAVGVALFPTVPALDPTHLQVMIGYVHYGFVAAFFLTLAYFCLCQFRKTDPSKPMTPQKVKRNRVYTVCGYIILACIALLAIYGAFLQNSSVAEFRPVSWLKAIAVIAFGASWLVKGEALQQDAKAS
jgi:hypothetical protein